MTRIVYLHGFNSAFDPQSSKVRQLAALQGISAVWGIDFAYHDDDVEDRLDDFMARMLTSGEKVIVAGTSLGGYFARYVADRFKLPQITINPSLEPWETLRRALGVEQVNFKTGERFTVHRAWLQRLVPLAVARVQVPALTVVSVDDEVLRFDAETLGRLAAESRLLMTEGGHRLEVLPADVMLAIDQFVNAVSGPLTP